MTLADLSVARLLALAEMTDAEARAQLAPLLGDIRPHDNRPWQEFAASSVIGLLLMHRGELAPALELLVRAARTRGADGLAVALIDLGRLQLYGRAMTALNHRRPDLARGALITGQRLLGSLNELTAERSLLELIEFVDAVTRRHAHAPLSQGRPTVIHLAVWGERFCRAAERTILPTLLAPGNVPALAEHGSVVVHLHTRTEDIATFRAMEVTQALERHARFEFTPIPTHLLEGTHLGGTAIWPRLLIGALQYDGLMFARSLGADLAAVTADGLLSGHCLSNAKRLLLSGREAVTMVPLRALAWPLLERLEAGGFRRGASLDVPAEALYRASLETLHPFIAQSFMSEPPQRLAVHPVQFYFPSDGGFVARCFHQVPVLISTRRLPADHPCDYHTLDTRLLSDVLAGLDPAATCHVHDHPPGDMYWVSIDEAEGVTGFGNFEFSPAGAAAAIETWMAREADIEHFRWAIGQRFEHALQPESGIAVPPGRAEGPAMAELMARLAERAPAIRAKLAEYRR